MDRLRLSSEQSDEVGQIVHQRRRARILNCRESQEPLAWLEEVHREPEAEVAEQERPEEVSPPVGTAGEVAQYEGQRSQPQDLVDLRGVARDPVSEVDTPGQIGGIAVRVVSQPRK